MSTVTNLSSLKIIASNNPTMMKVFINSFLKSAEASLVELETALNERDYNKMKKAAHTFKAQVGYMGIEEMTPIITQLEEDSAVSKNIDLFPDMVNRVKSITLQAIDELTKELEKL